MQMSDSSAMQPLFINRSGSFAGVISILNTSSLSACRTLTTLCGCFYSPFKLQEVGARKGLKV